MKLTLAQLSKIMPKSGSRAGVFINPLNDAMAEFEINTPARVASFLPQIAHESGQLTRVVESFNYRPEAIIDTFNTSKNERFSRALALQYGRTDDHPACQQHIANIAYANRMGNGASWTGDGYRYRGRGLIQITGRDNYVACMMALDIDCVARPELLELPVNACRSAAWFWKTNGLNALADKGDFHRITKIINGGYNGLEERLVFFAISRKELA